MALITQDLEIPDIQALFPSTRRRGPLRPCGTAAARRRHKRRREDCPDPAGRCAAFHRKDMANRRARAAGRPEPYSLSAGD